MIEDSPGSVKETLRDVDVDVVVDVVVDTPIKKITPETSQKKKKNIPAGVEGQAPRTPPINKKRSPRDTGSRWIPHGLPSVPLTAVHHGRGHGVKQSQTE